MHQMLCERTVGGPWARHLRLRRHSNSQVRQHARVACGCCCLSDTDQWADVNDPKPVVITLYFDLEDFLCMHRNVWEKVRCRHDKHLECLSHNANKTPLLQSSRPRAPAVSLDVSEQRQFDGRQMLHHSRDMFVKEHTIFCSSNFIWT